MFDVEIAAQYMIDINQILEQILPFFDPTAYIRITIPDLHIDHRDEATEEGAEPMDLKVVYEGGSYETNIDMGSDEYRSLLWKLQFKVEGYMYKPFVETPIIEHTITEYYDWAGWESGQQTEALITSTHHGLSAEKWPIDLEPPLSAALSAAYYSDSAKVWYEYEYLDAGIVKDEE
jgi:hypothetical protein